MSAQFIKNSKKVRLYNEIVELFRADNANKDSLSKVIPGIYVQTYIDPNPDDSNLVCVGHTSGATYYVPEKYSRVFNIRDHGHWSYVLSSPITKHEVVVSAHLANSAEVRLWTGV